MQHTNNLLKTSMHQQAHKQAKKSWLDFLQIDKRWPDNLHLQQLGQHIQGPLTYRCSTAIYRMVSLIIAQRIMCRCFLNKLIFANNMMDSCWYVFRKHSIKNWNKKTQLNVLSGPLREPWPSVEDPGIPPFSCSQWWWKYSVTSLLLLVKYT